MTASAPAIRPLAELVDGEPLVELDACWKAAWAAMASPADRALLETCQQRMAELLSHPSPAALPAAEAEAAASDAAVAAGLALTEQYLIDVSSATADQIDAVARELDGSVVDFVTALLVVEQRMRLELGLSRVLGEGTAPTSAVAPAVRVDRVGVRPSTPARAPRASGATRDLQLGAALMRFAAAAVRNDAVDPVTTELVRLRCATYHDCHT